jgi:hypothetical protein
LQRKEENGIERERKGRKLMLGVSSVLLLTQPKATVL